MLFGLNTRYLITFLLLGWNVWQALASLNKLLSVKIPLLMLIEHLQQTFFVNAHNLNLILAD